MAFDGLVNTYTNHWALAALGAPLAVLTLWLLSRIFTGGAGWFGNRGTVAAPGTIGAPGTVASGGVGVGNVGAVRDYSHSIGKALWDLFVLLMFGWLLNYILNGFNRGLMIFIWFIAAWGVLWAFLKVPVVRLLLFIPLAFLIAALFWHVLSDRHVLSPVH